MKQEKSFYVLQDNTFLFLWFHYKFNFLTSIRTDYHYTYSKDNSFKQLKLIDDSKEKFLQTQDFFH